jgi:hypothetical protein
VVRCSLPVVRFEVSECGLSVADRRGKRCWSGDARSLTRLSAVQGTAKHQSQWSSKHSRNTPPPCVWSCGQRASAEAIGRMAKGEAKAGARREPEGHVSSIIACGPVTCVLANVGSPG